MIKAVLFDLDGTLLNWDQSVYAFIENQYERLREELGFIPKERYVSRFIELDDWGYVWKDKVYRQLIDEFYIKGVSQEELLQDYLDHFKDHCVPFPYLNEMLEEMQRRELVLGIITNGYGQFQMNNIEALGIKTYFQTILVSEWEGVKKPDPYIFKKALAQLNVSAEEAIFVGDHPENDVQAARKVGMKGIWKRDAQWSDVEADAIIEDLAELVWIVETMHKTYSCSK